MKDGKIITIGLISHLFKDDNLGCVALAISNVMLIDNAADEFDLSVEYKILVNEKADQPVLNFTLNKYRYFVYSSCKRTLKHPVSWFRSSVFNDCDLVFNLCAGDGFTSIYGLGRTLSETYMTFLAKVKGQNIILAPQTIGPFKSKISRIIAKTIMNSCNQIFTRDKLSTQCCKGLDINKKVTEAIDVAFALPYSKSKYDEGLNVGINVSGLLYRGGYDRNNYFNLSFDYKKYIEQLILNLVKRKYIIHLIAHVISDKKKIEDDYSVCEKLSTQYQGIILAPKFKSPIEAKSYISGLDVFTGARMHATIAAISSGVPVIPIAYSRKVNGLYSSIDYPYFIDALDNKYTVQLAVDETIELIENRLLLEQTIKKSKQIYKVQLKIYSDELKNILGKL